MPRRGPALLAFALVAGALVGRVGCERHVRLEAARAETDPVARGMGLADAARWSWSFTGEREALLVEALNFAEKVRPKEPARALALAEEVRATLFVTRWLGSPTGPVLERANGMIVQLLADRDGLGDDRRQELAAKYAEPIGPSSLSYALSSIGFVLWLCGLALTTSALRGRRRLGFGLATGGLALFLTFLALA